MKTKEAKFSPRSQRSFEEQRIVQAEIAKFDSSIHFVERKIGELEEFKKYHLRDKRHDSLASTLRELEDQTRTLRAYKEERAALQSTLDDLVTVTSEELQARQPQQQAFAQLIASRLEKDRQADKAVEALRGILQERSELTAQMTTLASVLEFTIDPNIDALGTRRFDALRAALPAELAASSERWAGWFMGTGGLKPYIVRDERLVVPETLASHGVYFFGETIELTDDQARELLREDRPAPTPDKPWRIAPPSIMTVEAYEAVAALAAKRESWTVEDVLYHEWHEQDEERKAQYFNSYNAQSAQRNKDFQMTYQVTR
jgi:hypothetical protein